MNNDAGVETKDVRVDDAVEQETRVVSPDGEPSGNGASGSSEPAASTPTDQDDKKKRSWVAPVAVSSGLIAAIAVVVILLLMNIGNEQDGGARRGGRAAVDQADWKVTSYSLGGAHPARTGKAPNKEVRSLRRLIRRWHDSVYLFPADLRADTNKYFTRAAARAVRTSGLGPPRTAKQVETTKRTARIGIEAGGARRAAADVEIVAKGRSAKGKFRIATETHLWFEREGSKWKVVAFDVEQKPRPVGPQRKGGKADKRGDGGGRDRAKRNKKGGKK